MINEIKHNSCEWQENMIQVTKFIENMNQKKKKKGRGILTFS